MRIGTQIGVWTPESVWRVDDIEHVVRRISRSGMTGVELFAWQLASFRQEPGRLRKLLELCELELTGAYFDKGDFTDPGAHAAILTEAKWVAPYLAALGGGHLLLNGGVQRRERPFEDEDFQHVARLFNDIADVCANYGVVAALHPHFGCQIEGAPDVERLLAAGLDRGRVSLVIHAVHQVLSGHDPYALTERYPDWISYVHVGDVTAGKQGARLGEGVLDQDRLMRPLLERRYPGWFIIESGAPDVTQEQYVAQTKATLCERWGAVLENAGQTADLPNVDARQP